MSRWYRNAARCYAYLADEAFIRSQWSTRRWTLQELVAPDSVEIFARDWTRLGNTTTLGTVISSVTGISMSYAVARWSTVLSKDGRVGNYHARRNAKKTIFTLY
ncbi:uncharacterized protein CC84DRAFT_1248455 [Paraphaeosphaeria sporulosa]|uniref:Heterokaryon incompatibility domain-containing protein n=1 Tax=Paraphaeosphaeria sporulosa TaxID=1460663 RepID=A0A177C9K7_9PLEO|nr:uncharacterized protein CC84DRAFT_1248455 [Paraphaeosphaeria sporulosa]OAG03458.1 hypothetical protein CC84DRAFT_1248455 [Paraphaeosphaeria sporulosa]